MAEPGTSKKQNDRKIRMAVSFLAATFLLLLYFGIFFLSGQDGETSGSLSHRVTEVIVEQISRFAGRGWTWEFRDSMVAYWEHPVRKLAHFSEYAVMGILVYLLLRPWRPKNKKLYLLVILWVFVSASLDEGHQLMVEGRYASFMDVFLDTAGGGFGTLVCALADHLRV